MRGQASTPISIGEVIRNGDLFNFKIWIGEQPSTDPDSLLLAIQRLFELLDEREVEYVLVGEVALLSYVEGRNTQDIDLIMTASSLERLPEIQTTKAELDMLSPRFIDREIL